MIVMYTFFLKGFEMDEEILKILDGLEDFSDRQKIEYLEEMRNNLQKEVSRKLEGVKLITEKIEEILKKHKGELVI